MSGKLRIFKMGKNPMTDKYEPCAFMPNHFGMGIAGVSFQDGSIYNPAAVPIKFQEV